MKNDINDIAQKNPLGCSVLHPNLWFGASGTADPTKGTNLEKIKAILPDLRGDDWDSFVLQLAVHIRAVMATPIDLNDFTFPSDIFTNGVTVEIQKMNDHLSLLLWVQTNELDRIGASRMANLIRWKWWQGEDKAGMTYFLKQYPFPDSDTEIPRDISVPLEQLGVTPSVNWRF